MDDGEDLRERVRDYLSRNSHRCQKNGWRDEAEVYHLAWWVVEVSDSGPQAWEIALRRGLPPPKTRLPAPPPPERVVFCMCRYCVAGLPIEEVIDGRRGEQWLESAIAYLGWRAGDGWRHPLRDRFHPERDLYVRAQRVLIELLHSTVQLKPMSKAKKRPQRQEAGSEQPGVAKHSKRAASRPPGGDRGGPG